MATHLTLAHGTNARRDRARLVELSNAGTDWTGANGTITGRSGHVQGFGQLNADEIVSAQLWHAQYVIYSYATPIAWKTVDGEWVISTARYSRTTGRHQSYLYALRQPATV